MRTLLVLSRLTFLPGNQKTLVERLLGDAGQHLRGVVLIDNVNARTLAAIPFLLACGALRMGRSLLHNGLDLRHRRREKLFSDRGKNVIRVRDINDGVVARYVHEHDIDLLVNSRTESIFGRHLLDAPRLGCVNVHHGLLPEERGMMCDLFALAEHRDTGFSLHVMTDRVDRGPVLARHVVPTPKSRHYLDFCAASLDAEGVEVARFINEVAERNRLPEPLPHGRGRSTYRRLKGTPSEVFHFRRAGVVL